MPDPTFKGVFPYLVSPIDDAGHVKVSALEKLCEDLIQSGVHGLTPLGSTGEFAYLSPEQKRIIVEVAVSVANGRVPIVAGVAATTLEDAIAQTRQMEGLGCDGILGILESYFPVTDEGVFSYFEAIAKATALPIVLYTNPNFQRSDLSLPVIQKLSEIPNIAYIKDASVNTGRLLSIMTQVGDRLSVFAASSHIPACVMLLGGVGWMAGPACIVPRESVTLYNLCMSGDWEAAMALQRKLWPVNQIFARFNLAACVKAGLRIQGYDVGASLSPGSALSEGHIQEIRTVLSRFNDGPLGRL